MPVVQPLLLVVTVLWVGVCCYVCSRIHARLRAVVPSDSTLVRLRRRATTRASVDEPDGAPSVEEGLEEAFERRAVERSEEGAEELPLEERVVQEVLQAPTRPLAVLAINELTTEVSRSVQDARTLPSAVGRVALLGGTALGLVAIALALQNGHGGAAAMWGGACLMVALGGAVVCEIYGKLTRRAAERRREGARELIRLLERRLPGGGTPEEKPAGE